jgi:serine/threonine protein kinase
MNSRLLVNKWLTVNEILDIFCDMCEAVARLHHSKTPVIHRDLKIENVLIDQRSGSEKPVYVLCDFGSATTKVLSRDTHTIEQIDEEIRRYTTVSYRAPEMVDLFNGVPIGTKSDIWALGVMLYKLCYFALPFGESALAIQNGSFTFPDIPPIPEEIKAIINFLLTSSAIHRPNIFQTSYLAFSAANRKCPVYNIQRSPRIELLEAVKIFRMRDRLGANYSRALEKAINEAYSNTLNKTTTVEQQIPQMPPIPMHEEIKIRNPEIPQSHLVHSSSSNNPFLMDDMEHKVVPTPIAPVSTYIEPMNPPYLKTSTTTTSVNPRLRPKPTSSLNPQQPLRSPLMVPPVSPRTNIDPKQHGYINSMATNGVSEIHSSDMPDSAVKLQSITVLPQTSNGPIGLTKIEQNLDTMKISQISTESSKSAPEHNVFGKPFIPQHVPSMPITPSTPFTNIGSTFQQSTNLKASAFKPYSMTSRSQTNNAEKAALTFSTSSNPFLEQSQTQTESPNVMDDNAFGERFDELRRVNRRNTIGTGMNQPVKYNNRHPAAFSYAPSRSHTTPAFRPDVKILQLINEEPFSSAPFHPRQSYDTNRGHTWVG